MRELRTEIQISAPTNKVWQVLTDFDEWEKWNPVAKAKGKASVGSKLIVSVSGKDGKDGHTYEPIVMEANAPKAFRWRATMMAGFLFTNDRVFELREKNGGTELVHSEKFSGLMVPMFWKKMEQFVLPMLEKMNLALKAKLEEGR